jgi:SAM-dependent methyltransferase
LLGDRTPGNKRVTRHGAARSEWRPPAGTVTRALQHPAGEWARARVKAVLKAVLKPIVKRIPWALLLHAGALLLPRRAVHCPCCGGRFARMRRFEGRPSAKCPACGSLERHRTLWLYLRERTSLLSEPQAVLHFAPELAIERHLRLRPNLAYTAADLHPSRRDIVRADITATPFADGAFDVVLCNHVLEHVPDDRAAISELFRILTPGGRVICQHPIDEERATTYEDASVIDPRDRKRIFGQEDHVRIYGRDFRERLASAGFEVSVERYADSLPDPDARRYALRERAGPFRRGDIHVAVKPVA